MPPGASVAVAGYRRTCRSLGSWSASPAAGRRATSAGTCDADLACSSRASGKARLATWATRRRRVPAASPPRPWCRPDSPRACRGEPRRCSRLLSRGLVPCDGRPPRPRCGVPRVAAGRCAGLVARVVRACLAGRRRDAPSRPPACRSPVRRPSTRRRTTEARRRGGDCIARTPAGGTHRRADTRAPARRLLLRCGVLASRRDERARATPCSARQRRCLATSECAGCVVVRPLSRPVWHREVLGARTRGRWTADERARCIPNAVEPAAAVDRVQEGVWAWQLATGRRSSVRSCARRR